MELPQAYPIYALPAGSTPDRQLAQKPDLEQLLGSSWSLQRLHACQCIAGLRRQPQWRIADRACHTIAIQAGDLRGLITSGTVRLDDFSCVGKILWLKDRLLCLGEPGNQAFLIHHLLQ